MPTLCLECNYEFTDDDVEMQQAEGRDIERFVCPRCKARDVDNAHETPTHKWGNTRGRYSTFGLPLCDVDGCTATRAEHIESNKAAALLRSLAQYGYTYGELDYDGNPQWLGANRATIIVWHAGVRVRVTADTDVRGREFGRSPQSILARLETFMQQADQYATDEQRERDKYDPQNPATRSLWEHHNTQRIAAQHTLSTLERLRTFTFEEDWS